MPARMLLMKIISVTAMPASITPASRGASDARGKIVEHEVEPPPSPRDFRAFLLKAFVSRVKRRIDIRIVRFGVGQFEISGREPTRAKSISLRRIERPT